MRRREAAIALAVLLIPLALAVSLSACAIAGPALTSEDAVIIAKGAVSSQTKFFAKIGNETKPISNATITAENAYFDGKQWNVAFHIQGVDDTGTVRQNDVVVILDRQGQIIGLGSGKINPPPGK